LNNCIYHQLELKPAIHQKMNNTVGTSAYSASAFIHKIAVQNWRFPSGQLCALRFSFIFSIRKSFLKSFTLFSEFFSQLCPELRIMFALFPFHSQYAMFAFQCFDERNTHENH